MRPKYWNILHCGAMFLESDYSRVIAVQRYAQLNRYQLKGPRILLQGEIGNRIEAIPVNTERVREMSAVTVYTKPNVRHEALLSISEMQRLRSGCVAAQLL